MIKYGFERFDKNFNENKDCDVLKGLSKLFYCCLEIIISVAGKKFMIQLLHGIKNRVFIPKWNCTKRAFSPLVSSIVR